MYSFDAKQIKYLIPTILSIGLFSTISVATTQSSPYKKLVQNAVMGDNIEATKFLIQQGADVNYKYKYSHTLLHSAALYGVV